MSTRGSLATSIPTPKSDPLERMPPARSCSLTWRIALDLGELSHPPDSHCGQTSTNACLVWPAKHCSAHSKASSAICAKIPPVALSGSAHIPTSWLGFSPLPSCWPHNPLRPKQPKKCTASPAPGWPDFRHFAGLGPTAHPDPASPLPPLLSSPQPPGLSLCSRAASKGLPDLSPSQHLTDSTPTGLCQPLLSPRTGQGQVGCS